MKLIKSGHSWFNQLVNSSILQHIAYWVTYVCFFGVIWGTYDMDFKKTFSIELISLPSKFFIVYTVVYFLMPRFLFQKKASLFWTYFILALLLAAVVQRLLDNYVIMRYYLPDWFKRPSFHPVALLSTTLQMTAVLAIPATIKFFRFFSMVQQKQQQLEKEKLEAELMFLKNQVQPHFLFNTLNSLYALIIKKSDVALDVFLGLSDLLRYLLYEANAPLIALSKEANFVNSYVDLERVRFGKAVKISLKISGNMEDKQIAPLLIIPFVENSVKHSTGGYNHTAKIAIEMIAEQNSFLLKVQNNMPSEKEVNEGEFSGIGLQNVRKRLDMLYEHRHTLEIAHDQDTFRVLLKIDL